MEASTAASRSNLGASTSHQDKNSQSQSNSTDSGSRECHMLSRNIAIEDGRSLHTLYQRIERAHKFFKPGRVFSAIWIEPAGPLSENDVNNITRVDYNLYAFTKPSRFISIRNQKGFCVALRIHTFGGRGDEKFNSRPTNLFFVHSSDEEEDLSRLGTNVLPIKVEDPDINFTAGKSVVLASKPYSIEHYLPIRNIGYVVKPSLAMLESAFIESLGKDSRESRKSSQSTAKKAAALPRPDSEGPAQLGQLANKFSPQSSRDNTTGQIPVASDGEPAKHGRTSQATTVDGDPFDQKRYFCDGDHCPRQGQPFNRIEHLRDHLRDYHLEDILRNRRFGDESKRIGWFNSREVDKDWWRCKRCVEKVVNSQNRWLCPRCRQPCEHDRIKNRLEKYPGYYDETGFPLTSLGPRAGHAESGSSGDARLSIVNDNDQRVLPSELPLFDGPVSENVFTALADTPSHSQLQTGENIWSPDDLHKN